MTITINQSFDYYDLEIKEILHLLSWYKSCKILGIDGKYINYSFESGKELEDFLSDIKSHVVPYCEHTKSNTFKAKFCRFIRKLTK